jgi:hypothetical protein
MSSDLASDIECMAYTFGAWLGDGHRIGYSTNPCITVSDQYIPLRCVEDTRHITRPQYDDHITTPTGTRMYRVYWYDKRMIDLLWILFGPGYKSSIDYITDNFSRPAKLEFLAGLMDTDGSAPKQHEKYISIKLSSNVTRYTALEGFQRFCDSIGLDISLYDTINQGNPIRIVHFHKQSFLDNQAYFRLYRKMSRIHDDCTNLGRPIYYPPYNSADYRTLKRLIIND